MSTILKALKKVEEEKGRSNTGGTFLARDILHGGSSRRRRTRRGLAIFLCVTVIGGAAGSYVLTGGFNTADHASAALTAADDILVDTTGMATAPRPVAVGDLAARPERPQASIAEAFPVDDAAVPPAVKDTTVEALKETALVLRHTAEVLKEKVDAAASGARATGGLDAAVEPEAVEEVMVNVNPVRTVAAPVAPLNPVSVPRPAAAQAPEISQPVAKVVKVQAPSKVLPSRLQRWMLEQRASGGNPELIVSEIHYRTEVQERLAVVNDLPVMEGMSIDGARVDRIFRDRIRFDIQGRYLEVLVSPGVSSGS